MKITRQTGSFQAKSDSGQSYTVIEFQEFDSILTSIGTITESEGLKIWKTSAGYPVKQIDPSTYRITTTNEIVRKV